MTTANPAPVFRIVRTGKGMGGFLAPPGHPDHFYEVRGYWPRGNRAVTPSLRREADSYSSLSSAIENKYGDIPEHVVSAARRIMDRAELTCPEAWVRSVYGYFRNSYSPDGADRNVSNAVITSKLHCRCGDEFYGRKGLLRHLEQLDPMGESTTHYQVAKPLPPAEHHLAYLHIREFFPDHQPRTDLIADPDGGQREH